MRALVIGSSGGIGGAIATALAVRGEVVGLSRRDDGLDITDEDSIARLIGGLEGPFDLIVVATGALIIDGIGPEKTLKALSAPPAFRRMWQWWCAWPTSGALMSSSATRPKRPWKILMALDTRNLRSARRTRPSRPGRWSFDREGRS